MFSIIGSFLNSSKTTYFSLYPPSESAVKSLYISGNNLLDCRLGVYGCHLVLPFFGDG
jgi:hypothetical protein